ncbi:pseudaminic acid biosynthesis-associated methylase [Paenibacillus sp. FSL H8-0034]|uniref:pseudaminic acid biosynthesis-associated methylase n=1 Tax=Paenibacillus sp. FSL H8-0034 TaxID=2954671 RepID=UPI0030F7536E
MQTKQTDFWQSDFGADYTERNTLTVKETNQLYIDEYGVDRETMNREFLEGLTLQRILEVGCNVGNQLRCLQYGGYNNLYGIEIQSYAVEKAKELSKGINIIQGSGFDIPFRDGYFDLAFTSGVLIHISPEDINRIIDETYRVSSQYIWGFEYFAEQHMEIPYRGNSDKMWKANFAQLFIDRYPDLKLVKEQKYKYVYNDNVDQMYLLEKR